MTGIIHSCPLGYSEHDIIDRCEDGAQGLVVDEFSNQWYRNIYCAICNGVEDFGGLVCQPPHGL